MHRHFSFLIMFRVCIFKKSTFCGYLATFSGHIRHSAAICCHFATSLRDEKHKQWCFHLFLLCNSLPFLGLMTDPFQLFSYIWKEIVVPSLLLWGCSGQLKEDRILSLHDSNKCFLKLKGVGLWRVKMGSGIFSPNHNRWSPGRPLTHLLHSFSPSSSSSPPSTTLIKSS